MFNVQAMLNQIIQNNPKLQENQNAANMIAAIRNNDERAGIEIADGILRQYGMTREQGMQLAQQFFSGRR